MKNRSFTNEMRPWFRAVRRRFPRAECVPGFGGEDERDVNLETEIEHDPASRAHTGLSLNLNSHPGRDQKPSLPGLDSGGPSGRKLAWLDRELRPKQWNGKLERQTEGLSFGVRRHACAIRMKEADFPETHRTNQLCQGFPDQQKPQALWRIQPDTEAFSSWS